MDPRYSGGGGNGFTWEVMVAPHDTAYEGRMTSLAAPRPVSTLRVQAITAGVILAAFTVFSLWVVAGHGYTGFLALAGREPWALQMLLDLVIALSFALGWLRADARKRGIAAWPYFVATVLLGSIGILVYVVRRGFLSTSRDPAS
jgi:hypothetical protein